MSVTCPRNNRDARITEIYEGTPEIQPWLHNLKGYAAEATTLPAAQGRGPRRPEMAA